MSWTRTVLLGSFAAAGLTRVSHLSAARWILCDPYPESVDAIVNRTDSQRLVVFAGGSLPRGAEPLSTVLLAHLRTSDVLLTTCTPDTRIARAIFGTDLTVVQIRIPTMPEWPRERAKRAGAAIPYLVYHGRVNRQKNIDLVLLVLRDLLRLGFAAKLKIIGGEDGVANDDTNESNAGCARELRTLSRELGVADQVSWIPECSGASLVDHVVASGIGVNLSTYNRENFGMTTAEHVVSGLPIVVSDWGGLGDQGLTYGGLLVRTSLVASRPTLDVSGLAERIADRYLGGGGDISELPSLYPAANASANLRPVLAEEWISGVDPIQSYDYDIREALLDRARRAEKFGVNPRLTGLDPCLHDYLLGFYASGAK